jgi:hypothetical protein
MWLPKNAETESERRVCEAEGRISRQTALIERLTAAGDMETAQEAGELLCLLQDGLELMNTYIRIRRRACHP